MDWKLAIENWRKLPPEERRQRHLRAIPRHVANSMAMANEPVSEQLIREMLLERIPELIESSPPSAD
jgi:hypothetical protein